MQLHGRAAQCGRARVQPRSSTLLAAAALAVALAAVPAPAEPATDPDPEGVHREGVRFDRVALLAAGGSAAHWLGFRYFDRAWYQGQRRDSIRWLHDWSGETYVHMDKGGHFLGGMYLSHSLGEAYRWTGAGARAAALLGALTSWGLLFEVEMRDAYYDAWGFSVPDFVANSLGATVPLVHALLPATRCVAFKFSWWPSPLYRDYDARLAAGRPRTQYAIDDYEGMTFWATLGVDEVLRGRARWPDGLGLAVGVGATGMHGANVKSRGPEREYPERPDARPEVFLALDYDARHLPGRGWLWDGLKAQLSWLHFPAPALRVYPTPHLYLLYL